MSLLLLLLGSEPTSGLVARGVVKPVRVRTGRDARPRAILTRQIEASAPAAITGTGEALFGLTVDGSGTATPPPITGTATALFGLTVTATGTVPASGGGLVGRGVVRPVRGRRDPRTSVRTGPQQLARTAFDVTGTGTAAFGLTVTGAGTVTVPTATGTATVLFGLTVTGTGTAILPVVTGTGTALFGLTLAASGTFTAPAASPLRVLDATRRRVTVTAADAAPTITAVDTTRPRVTAAARPLFPE